MPKADKHTNNIITVEKTGEKVKVSDILKIGGKRIIVAADSADLRYFIEEGFVEYKYKEVTDPVLQNKCFAALAKKSGFLQIFLIKRFSSVHLASLSLTIRRL